MKKLLIALCLVLAIVTGAKAEFFSDVILTGTQGIWVDARSYSSLDAAVTAIGANDRELVIVSPQIVTSLTIPSNIRLKFIRNGSITNSGQLTINTKNIEAENRQIFTGVGNIDFAAGTILKTAWFSNIETAFALTNNDTITLIVSKPQTITASYSPGNNVTLKWEAASNTLTANAGVTVSNIGQIEAGNYQLLAGAGNFRFRDGSNLNLKWFPYLRTALTWINTNNVTLVVNESSPVDYSDSIPSNIQVKINKGGDLAISPGITLTINSAKQIDIGPYFFDPFTGTGNVTISGGDTYTPATSLTASVLSVQLTSSTYEIDALLAYGNGTSFTKATIDAALTNIGTTKSTLLLRPGNWVVNAALAFPENVTVHMPYGAYFSGTAVTERLITGMKHTTPQMFGGFGRASTVDTSDDQAAFNAAIIAAGRGGSVEIPESLYGYRIASAGTAGVALLVDTLPGISIYGHGLRSAILLDAGAGVHLLHIISSPNYTLRNFSVIGLAGTTGDGIRIGGNTTVFQAIGPNSYGVGTAKSSNHGLIDNIWAYGFGGAQISVLDGQTTRITNTKINGSTPQTFGPYAYLAGLFGTPKVGIFVDGQGGQSHGTTLSNIVSEGMGQWGIAMVSVLNGKILGATSEGSGDGRIRNILSSGGSTPIEITTTVPHGYVTGQTVLIEGHYITGGGSIRDFNGFWTITVTGATTFNLDGSIHDSNVGGEIGTVTEMTGDLYLKGCWNTMVAGLYTETGVPVSATNQVRNILDLSGRYDKFVDVYAGGGAVEFSGGIGNIMTNLVGSLVKIDGSLTTGAGGGGAAESLWSGNQINHSNSVGGSFIDSGLQSHYSGLINSANENRQPSAKKRDSNINWARNGGFERWVSTASLDSVSSAWGQTAGTTIVRTGDGESDTTKHSGHYAVLVTAGVTDTASIVYNGPLPVVQGAVAAAARIGDPVTITVWAKPGTGSPTGFGIDMHYGGSVDNGNIIFTSVEWAKYSYTFHTREGSTCGTPYLRAPSEKSVYFDDFMITAGESESFSSWDNAKVTEPEPQGHHTLAFSATPTIYADVATFQTMLLSNNLTGITLANGVPGQILRLKLTQDDAGNRTVAWTTTINWIAASAPTITVAAYASDIISLMYDGTEWYCVGLIQDLR